SLANKAHQGSGGDTSHQANKRRVYGRLHGKGKLLHSVTAKKSNFILETVRGGNKPNFKKIFKNKQRPDRKPDRFSLLTKTPKEIFALEKEKFKAPPPMVTPVDKRDPNKYCEFHSDTGHSTDDCMQLRKQIDEMIKARKLSPKKGEASRKDKPLTILMIQPWERVAKPRITQSFSPETADSSNSIHLYSNPNPDPDRMPLTKAKGQIPQKDKIHKIESIIKRFQKRYSRVVCPNEAAIGSNPGLMRN
ncbi:hypothetical protein Tco_0124783, partial [Tanacetum coccineum]